MVLTSAATNDDTTAKPPEEKQEPLWKKFGEAGVIAYVGINVFWYAIGVNLFLGGMPIKQAGGAKLAYKRFLAAWGLCFAASHSTICCARCYPSMTQCAISHRIV